MFIVVLLFFELQEVCTMVSNEGDLLVFPGSSFGYHTFLFYTDCVNDIKFNHFGT